jgi:hypothetical protein
VNAGEVMNFDSLINDDNDYYIGEDSDELDGRGGGNGLLKPISEDAQEESISPQPKDKLSH